MMSSSAAATKGRVFYTGYKFWFASSCYLGEYLQLPWVEKLCLIICKDQKQLLLLLAKFVKTIPVAEQMRTILEISVVDGWLHAMKKG